MTQYSFKKARLATAVALISSTALLTGCLVDGDKSNSTSNTTHQDADRIVISQQQAQKAQVVGIVQDTNGNPVANRSEEHTSELQSRPHLVCRLLLEKKN